MKNKKKLKVASLAILTLCNSTPIVLAKASNDQVETSYKYGMERLSLRNLFAKKTKENNAEDTETKDIARSDITNDKSIKEDKKTNSETQGDVPDTQASDSETVQQTAAIPEQMLNKSEGKNEAIDTLLGLGILENNTGIIDPASPVTGQEFTQMIVRATGLGKLANTQGYFPVAKANGLIESDLVGDITLGQAVTIALKAAGYDPKHVVPLQAQSDSPESYFIIAQSEGYLTGIQSDPNALLLKKDAAQLIFNTLNLPIWKLKDALESEKEKTTSDFLNEKLGINVIEGKITAVGAYLPAENGVGYGNVKIGEDTFVSNDPSIIENFGLNVKAYIKSDPIDPTKQTLVYAYPTIGEGAKVRFSKSDIEENGINSGADGYSVELKNGNKYKLELANVKIFRNWQPISSGFEELLKDVKNAEITLVDTDNNSGYDLVVINEYKSFVVGSVTPLVILPKSAGDGLIYKNNGDIDSKFFKNGEEILPENIKSGDVLIYQSSEDGKVIRGKVFETSVLEGTINELIDGNIALIGGQIYKFSPFYGGPRFAGTSGRFYINQSGEIEAVEESNITQAHSYGYLVDAIIGDEVNDKSLMIRLFTSEGMMTDFVADKNFTVNGKEVNADNILTNPDISEAAKTKKIKEGVVRYEIQDGKITSIITPKVSNDSNPIPVGDDFILNVGLKSKDETFNATTGKIGRLQLNNNTLIFEVDKNSKNDEVNYRILRQSDLTDGAKYGVYAYNVGEDYSTPMIVINETNASILRNSFAIVRALSQVQDGSFKLYIYENGKESSLTSLSDAVFSKGGDRLAKGDVIRYAKDDKGNVTEIQLLFDSEVSKLNVIQEPTEKIKFIYGTLSSAFPESGSINVTANGLESNYQIANSNVYIVESKDVEIDNAALLISGLKDFPVLVKTIDERVAEVVIYAQK